MSIMVKMKNPPGEPPPPPSRLYWICQAAGWGSFVLYTLGFYIVFATVRWEVILSIVVIDGLLCPALTHALRAPHSRQRRIRSSRRVLDVHHFSLGVQWLAHDLLRASRSQAARST